MSINVFSMFDGVGGFIYGLSQTERQLFNVVACNQFEPSRKAQEAYEVGVYRYKEHFPGIEHIKGSVSEITNDKYEIMCKAGVDMIVAGFPCQDYSVARSKKDEKGIEGKKGVLFWEIIRAVELLKPDYLLLENVDRLLKSPSVQRGRDFSIMLAQLNALGYYVEWRVINAAQYGNAQRRRRVFIFIMKNNSHIANVLHLGPNTNFSNYIFKDGLFAKAFPVRNEVIKGRNLAVELPNDLVKISEDVSNVFWNSGCMVNGTYHSIETAPILEVPKTLGEMLQDESDVCETMYISAERCAKFQYLREAKKINRISTTGHEYLYSEGKMSDYDSLDLPARTMLTSEGTLNRSTHFLRIGDRYRILTPIETERLQGLPDDWTKYRMLEDGTVAVVSDRMRRFFMGNALVTTVVTRIGNQMEELLLEK